MGKRSALQRARARASGQEDPAKKTLKQKQADAFKKLEDRSQKIDEFVAATMDGFDTKFRPGRFKKLKNKELSTPEGKRRAFVQKQKMATRSKIIGILTKEFGREAVASAMKKRALKKFKEKK